MHEQLRTERDWMNILLYMFVFVLQKDTEIGDAAYEPAEPNVVAAPCCQL